MNTNQPRVSTLELLRRVRDEARPIRRFYVEIHDKLFQEITECVTQAEQSTLTPERLTAAVQATDALFSAIQNVVSLPNLVLNTVGKNWYVCAYCDSRSIRKPLQHRAGCAWSDLKQAWDNYPGNPASRVIPTPDQRAQGHAEST